ncbi:hypothetical protein D3C78_1393400 [compost metagenome]
MVALPPRDEVHALRLAILDMELAGHLQCRFHGLGTAREEIDIAQLRGALAGQQACQALGGLTGEEAGVGVLELFHLGADGGEHGRVAVSQARDGGTAGAVEVPATLGVEQVAAFSAQGDRQRLGGGAMEDVSHALSPCPSEVRRDRWCAG